MILGNRSVITEKKFKKKKNTNPYKFHRLYKRYKHNIKNRGKKQKRVKLHANNI